jgi:hypothetical protein
MMTEALLAVYPDVFKAGAEFSGVPAGCWAVNYSASGEWSGPCAGGQVTHTAQQWGTLVRAMDPGYSGYRPRVQLWHGESDTTINFNDQTEAIKEWSDVLGLSATPSSMATVTFNNHTWTHESWKNACGFTVLDAWSELNGPHGTDANLNATYVIPFLGLDKAGPTDPEVAECRDAGSSAGGGPGEDGGAGDGSANASSGGPSGSSGSGGGTNGSGAGVVGASSGGPLGTIPADAGESATGAGSPNDDASAGGADNPRPPPAPSPGAGCSCRQAEGPASEDACAIVFITAVSAGLSRRRRKRRSSARG